MQNTEALRSSATNEWYTPYKYIAAAREVLGEIDLDPASSYIANKTVQATAYYSEAENSLLFGWMLPSPQRPSRVWMNPPYGTTKTKPTRSNQMVWSRKLMDEYRLGHVCEAIMLVNAQTGEKWFKPLWQFTICFHCGRIKFNDELGRPGGGPTHGSAFIYMGQNPQRFAEVFKEFGEIHFPFVATV